MNIYKIKLIKEELNSSYEKNISCPTDAVEIIRDFIADKNDRECFGVLLLNTKNVITGVNLVSIGSLNSSIVTPSNVIKPALLSNAAAIICFHNHPSGDPTASEDDIDVTNRLDQACELMGVDLLDHLIVGDGYYSLKTHGDF